MKNVSTLKISCIAILGLIAAHMAYYWGSLPDTMATHFGADWEPNGWMSKGVFMMFYAGIVGLIALSFIGIIPFLHKIPVRFINLPKREYWLADERKEETINSLSISMIRLHNITQTFILAVMHMTIKYNVDNEHISPDIFWTLFTAYVVYMLYWTVMLMVKYARVPQSAE